MNNFEKDFVLIKKLIITRILKIDSKKLYCHFIILNSMKIFQNINTFLVKRRENIIHDFPQIVHLENIKVA